MIILFKPWPIIVALLLFTLTASSQASFTITKDPDKIKAKIVTMSNQLESVKCDFTQEKSLSMLKEKVMSTGIFIFKKENKIRLEYRKPFTYLMILNAGKLFVKDNSHSSKTDLHKNQIFKQINQIIMDCINGNILNNKDFSSKILENTGFVKLNLQPLSDGMKSFISYIAVQFDKKDYSVSQIEINEVSGDKTTITFSNKEINARVEDSTFSFK
jgi:outer membrane lipoprotein-sorting protein